MTPVRDVRVPRPSNLLDVLRLVAAAMVVIGRSWSLLGIPGVPSLAGITIHHLGVYIFFAISGFLLSVSWSRSPQTGCLHDSTVLEDFSRSCPSSAGDSLSAGPVAHQTSVCRLLARRPNVTVPTKHHALRPVRPAGAVPEQ